MYTQNNNPNGYINYNKNNPVCTNGFQTQKHDIHKRKYSKTNYLYLQRMLQILIFPITLFHYSQFWDTNLLNAFFSCTRN